MLCINGVAGQVLALVPLALAADGRHADLHLARSNGVAAAVPGPAVLAVAGPYAYVSPDWHGVDDQVPTWNLIAGQLNVLSSDTLDPHLNALSDRFAADLTAKRIWESAKMT